MSGKLQAQWRGVERAPSPTGLDRRRGPHQPNEVTKLVVRRGV